MVGQCCPTDCSFVQQKPPGGKGIRCSTKKQKKAVGQNKHIHSQKDLHTSKHSGIKTAVRCDSSIVTDKCGRLVADGEESKVHAIRSSGPQLKACSA